MTATGHRTELLLSTRLLELLLGAQLVGVTAFLLAAIHGARRQACVTLTTDLLVAVVFPGEELQRWLDHTTAEAQDQVESRLFLDVVVGQSAAVLELLPCENEALLVRGYALFVLNFRFHVVDGVRGF